MNKDPYFSFSLTIAARPRRNGERVEKGVLILNKCDEAAGAIPGLKDYFYLVERRGWFGPSEERSADVKLVDDPTVVESMKKEFPRAIVLPFASGDFVDTDKFHPLGIPKRYAGIQISAWRKFKRHDLFVRAAALLPGRKFMEFGHYWNEPGRRPWGEEWVLKKKTIRLAGKLGADVEFPFAEARRNSDFPNDAATMNRMLNAAAMGILTAGPEGINRFKMECLAADVPMLVAEDAGPATTRHINEKTGILFEPTPEKLAEAIRYAEGHLADFSPRAYVLEHTGIKNALPVLKNALRELARRDGFSRDYEEVYWDGRNENFLWAKGGAIAKVREAIKSAS